MKLLTKNVIKQGKTTITITTSLDAERNVEVREMVMQQGRKRSSAVFETDLATGKLLPLPGLEPSSGAMPSSLNEALRGLADELARRAENMNPGADVELL